MDNSNLLLVTANVGTLFEDVSIHCNTKYKVRPIRVFISEY